MFKRKDRLSKRTYAIGTTSVVAGILFALSLNGNEVYAAEDASLPSTGGTA